MSPLGSPKPPPETEAFHKLSNAQEKEPHPEEKAHPDPPSFPLEHKPLTRSNILSSLPTAPKIPQPGYGCIVARIRSDIVVKYGSKRVHINEANTMRLVRQRSSSIALPEVFDAWTAAEQPEHSADQVLITYIVMKYVPGTVLHHKWPLLSPAEQELLVQRVAAMLKELRTIEVDSPGPVGEPIRCEGFYFTDYKAGPFPTKQSLEKWLYNRLEVCKLFRRISEERPELVVERLVICHMDLNEHNIIIGEGDGRPWIIDWGCAGGYPACFELGSLRICQGEFARLLEKEVYVDEEDRVFLRRLGEMTFAFTTGALCRREDMDLDS